MDDSKVHWERIYKTKTPQEVSWTENEPNMSLELISKAKLSLDAQIIDVGGGDSQLVDRLIDLGYKNLTNGIRYFRNRYYSRSRETRG